MLEDALKRSDSGQSKDVGWRRTSVREGEPGTQRTSLDRSNTTTEYSSLPTTEMISPPNSATPPPSSDNRFFKFKFSSMSSNTRPGTPTQSIIAHLNSPSMPSLSSLRSKELEELTTELEKEKTARKAIAKEKTDLEDELESLSQALFEEVRYYKCFLNKVV